LRSPQHSASALATTFMRGFRQHVGRWTPS
jgi:hypothetical protein